MLALISLEIGLDSTLLTTNEETTQFHLIENVGARTHVVSEAQIEFLQDEQVPAEQRSGHGHVTNGLTNHRHGGAAAIQL